MVLGMNMTQSYGVLKGILKNIGIVKINIGSMMIPPKDMQNAGKVRKILNIHRKNYPN
jgi:hypothetical protein